MTRTDASFKLIWCALLASILRLLWGPTLAWPAPQTEAKNAPTTQAAGGVEAGEPKFRLIRSLAGSKGGDQAGKFIMEDPRTVFYFPEDQQVIVYFEWEGPLGPHHLEGRWKNPEGKVVVLSDFKYEAKQRRFGAFWTLMLSENIASTRCALSHSAPGS